MERRLPAGARRHVQRERAGRRAALGVVPGRGYGIRRQRLVRREALGEQLRDAAPRDVQPELRDPERVVRAGTGGRRPGQLRHR